MYVSKFRRPCFSRVAAWTLFAATTLFLAAESPAQQFMIQGGGNDKDAIAKQFKEQLASKKVAAANRLACRIADISRACNLSEMQIKKLEIAAKGAVKATMRKAQAGLVQQAKMMGVEFDPDEDTDEEAVEEAEDENDGNAPNMAANVMRAVIIDGAGSNRGQPAEKQKIWTSSVKKVLSDEQSIQWKQWQADRKAYQMEMAVGSFVAKADRRLLLSGEQREKLAAHLSEKHGELLRKRASRRESGQMAGMPIFVVNAMNNGGNDNEAEDDEVDTRIGEILSEAQLELWKKEFAPKLTSNPGGNMMGGGAFNVGPINLNVNGAAIGINGAVDVFEMQDNVDENEDDK